MAVITPDESAAMLSYKGEIIEEYRDLIMNALIQMQDDGKGHRPDLIVDDRGNTTLLIREGKKTEDLFLEDGTIAELRPGSQTTYRTRPCKQSLSIGPPTNDRTADQ